MKVWNVMNELKHVALIAKHHRGPQYPECTLKKIAVNKIKN
jgi:hypothetical protein